MKKVTVKWSNRLDSGHLWIFANEVVSALSHYEKGEVVRIFDHRGRFKGIGYINPNSLIAVRIITKDDEEIDKNFFEKRVKKALDYRKSLSYTQYDSFRLVFAESDGLPGIIIDKYCQYFSVQVLTAGMEKLLPYIKDCLIELFAPKGIVLRNDSAIRELEGLPLCKDVIFGVIDSMPVIEEKGVFYKVDLMEGQKTGFFLDQRVNRIYLRDIIERGKVLNALDCFSYSGGWALSAVYKNDNIKMTAVDISERSFRFMKENMSVNKCEIDVIKEDVFDYLRKAKKEGINFDLIILDPPAFIKSKSKIKEGIKGYKEINLAAMKLLSPEGVLVTSSCSHHLSREAFLEVLKEAARDCQRQFKIIKMSGQSEDHPVLLSMPETEYLKTFFLKVE